MQSHGIGRLIITSRTASHATTLAESIGGTAMPWDSLNIALEEADILITATGASTPIISRALIAQTMKARRQRPLFIIDIAVPRDVEATAGELEEVFLYNIDDLQAVVQENISKSGTEASDAEKIVSQEVGKFLGWLNSRGAVPTVVALRHRFESIRQAELRRLEPKLASLPPEARARVDEITRLIVEKLLINPTERLKSISDADTVAAYSDALNRLFNLTGDEPTGRSDADDRRSDPLARRNPHSEHPPSWQPREPSGDVPGAAGGRADSLRPAADAAGDRRHQDLRRSPPGGSALGNRRQAAVREGN